MSTIVQRPGRSGYYLQVPVPKSLRSKLGNSIKRKAGNTHREALANRSKVEAAIQRKFGVEMNTLSLIEKVEASYDSIPDLKGVTVGELPESDKEKLKDAYPIQLDEKGHAINPQEGDPLSKLADDLNVQPKQLPRLRQGSGDLLEVFKSSYMFN